MKAIIFDMDGLLVNTEMISLKIYQTLLKPYRIPFTQEEYSQHYSGKTEIANITRFIESFRLPWSIEEIVKKVQELEKSFIAEGVDLKPGAKELIMFLKDKGYPIALATSSTKERAFQILKQHGLENSFDATVFAGEVEHSKPAPDIFLKACERLAVSPSDALVFEDSEAGIEAAYTARIPVICIPDMKHPAANILALTSRTYATLEEAIEYFSE